MCALQVIPAVLSTFQERGQRNEATASRMSGGPGWRAFSSRGRRPRAMPRPAPCPRSGGTNGSNWVTEPGGRGNGPSWPLHACGGRASTARQPCKSGQMGELGASEASLWVNGAGWPSADHPTSSFRPTRSIVVGDRTRRCTSRRADLKMLHDDPSFINVRAAGERRCSVDISRNRPEKRGNDLAHEWRAGLACLQVEVA